MCVDALLPPEDMRQRGDSSPCGQSPMDFESISLATRTHCHDSGWKNQNGQLLVMDLALCSVEQTSGTIIGFQARRKTHMIKHMLFGNGCFALTFRGHKAALVSYREQLAQAIMVTCYDSEGIGAPAGRAQWISSPSPWPLGHTVMPDAATKANLYTNRGVEVLCFCPARGWGVSQGDHAVHPALLM
jgi:hypothetical protein